MSIRVILDRSDTDEKIPVSKIDYPIGWIDVFKKAEPELELVSNILGQLGVFFPLKKNLFRAFDECPLNNVNVVILGQDPYHSTFEGLPQANGMAFSTGKGCPIQPSLRNIYKELSNEYPDFGEPEHGDLSSWANQGVLLLNTCLTVMPHQAESHKEIWNGFITKVLAAVGYRNPECIYLLWGAKSQRFESLLGQRAIKLKASHPSPFSAHRGTKDSEAFIGSNHFKLTNDYLVQQGKSPINWSIV